jgi:hypothetical protein
MVIGYRMWEKERRMASRLLALSQKWYTYYGLKCRKLQGGGQTTAQ